MMFKVACPLYPFGPAFDFFERIIEAFL